MRNAAASSWQTPSAGSAPRYLVGAVRPNRPGQGMISQELDAKRKPIPCQEGIGQTLQQESDTKLMPIMRGTALLTVLVLAGCTSAFDTAVDSVGEPFVQPHKYDFLRCQDLVAQATGQEGRIKDIHELMERSGDSVGGTAVNVLVYGPDLKEAEAMLRLIRKTQAEKGCDKNAGSPGLATGRVPVAATPVASTRKPGTAVPPVPPAYSRAAGNLDPLH